MLLQRGDALPTYRGVPVTPEQRERWDLRPDNVFLIKVNYWLNP